MLVSVCGKLVSSGGTKALPGQSSLRPSAVTEMKNSRSVTIKDRKRDGEDAAVGKKKYKR